MNLPHLPLPPPLHLGLLPLPLPLRALPFPPRPLPLHPLPHPLHDRPHPLLSNPLHLLPIHHLPPANIHLPATVHPSGGGGSTTNQPRLRRHLRPAAPILRDALRQPAALLAQPRVHLVHLRSHVPLRGREQPRLLPFPVEERIVVHRLRPAPASAVLAVEDEEVAVAGGALSGGGGAGAGGEELVFEQGAGVAELAVSPSRRRVRGRSA
ncbi:hypothetical protein VTK26DRAFT_2428 [Humicola hyalothermophila]